MDALNRSLMIGHIARRVREAGGRAMLVGGCVRDALLGRESGDIDCEVYGLAPDVLRAIAGEFGQVDESGARYGVYSLRAQGIDLAVPRLERRTGPLHGDFEVTPDPSLPVERAAMRRDFTVNAILRDALTGEYVDPFGGREDLAKGILRAVPGGQFEEDPLRVLRGAQFAARFHLRPDEDTLRKMAAMPLDRLSAPRVLQETKKALLHAGEPDVFFDVLRRAGALRPWFAELHALVDVPQNPLYHPEGDAFAHTLLVLREAASVRAQAAKPLFFMLSALTHDLGKAVSTSRNARGDWQSVGHEHTGMPLVHAMLGRLGVSKEAIAYAVNMCSLHMRVHTCYYNRARIRSTNVLFDESVCPRELGLLAVCDARGTGKPSEQADTEEAFILERLERYERAISAPMPTGEMLLKAGAKPGPGMKKALASARRRVLCGEELGRAVTQAVRDMQSEEKGGA